MPRKKTIINSRLPGFSVRADAAFANTGLSKTVSKKIATKEGADLLDMIRGATNAREALDRLGAGILSLPEFEALKVAAVAHKLNLYELIDGILDTSIRAQFVIASHGRYPVFRTTRLHPKITPLAPYSIGSPTQAIKLTKVLIASFDEVLSYDRAKHHNQVPPGLWIDDTSYLDEIRSLVAELRRLNDILEKPKLAKARAQKSVIQLDKHFNKFLSNYAGAMGKGTAALTIGVIAALLYHAGIGEGVADGMWGHLRALK